MSIEWLAMCVGFATGALSVIGAIHITERENHKKKRLPDSNQRKRNLKNKL